MENMDNISTRTKGGRQINKINNDNDIIQYLGITDNETIQENKELRNNILNQAKSLEKVFINKMVDYCLEQDYFTYFNNCYRVIMATTQDLVAFIDTENMEIRSIM